MPARIPLTLPQLDTIISLRNRLPVALRSEFMREVAEQLRARPCSLNDPCSFNDRDVASAANAAMTKVMHGFNEYDDD
jgi:hypothetical protein